MLLLEIKLSVGWSYLYKELLLDAGIDSSRITIAGGWRIGSHKWVEIKFDDFILRADATANYNHSVDISASKSGLPTNGFILIPKDFANVDIRIPKEEIVYDNGEIVFIPKVPYEELRKDGKLDDKWLREIDDKLGYSTTNKYFDEILSELADDFYSPSIVERIFGINKNKVQNAKYEFFMNLSIFNNMNAYDAYIYLKQIKYILFNKDNNIKLDIFYRPSNNSFVPDGAVSILKFDNGNITCKIYDDELGLMNLTFSDMDEYNDYVSSLGYFG